MTSILGISAFYHDSAAALLKDGEIVAAAQEERFSRKKHDARYPYNAGVAAYRSKLYDQAQEYFDAASLAQDLQLQQQAFYNRGNSLFKSGEQEQDFQKKTQHWREALSQYENALELNGKDPLAADNLQFVKRALEELKPPPDQQDQQDHKVSIKKEQQDHPGPTGTA